MDDPIVEIENLSRSFGKLEALREITLHLSQGSICGLVGENGAGKTTLIKHLLGLLRAQTGSVRCFGLDPTKHPDLVLSRIGYLSEDRDFPGWMRIEDLMSYLKGFYRKWDSALATDLCRNFGLDIRQKIKTLSSGQKARTGLMQAIACQPDLLILDEPSSGLDPLVRRDILDSVIEMMAIKGCTVLFSSHLLNEVEELADQIVMLNKGGIILSDSWENIRANHCRLSLHPDNVESAKTPLPFSIHIESRNNNMSGIFRGSRDAIRKSLEEMNVTILEEANPTLEQIFFAYRRDNPLDGKSLL